MGKANDEKLINEMGAFASELKRYSIEASGDTWTHVEDEKGCFVGAVAAEKEIGELKAEVERLNQCIAMIEAIA